MKYIITYHNPSHNNPRTWTETYTSIAQVRAFIKKAKQYPGSVEIHDIEKKTAKGSEFLSW